MRETKSSQFLKKDVVFNPIFLDQTPGLDIQRAFYVPFTALKYTMKIKIFIG